MLAIACSSIFLVIGSERFPSVRYMVQDGTNTRLPMYTGIIGLWGILGIKWVILLGREGRVIFCVKSYLKWVLEGKDLTRVKQRR